MFEDCRHLQALRCEGYNATCPAPGADESWQGGGKGGKNEGPEILSIAPGFPARPTFTREREMCDKSLREREREREDTHTHTHTDRVSNCTSSLQLACIDPKPSVEILNPKPTQTLNPKP
jgi:hypothetical protein